MLERRGLACQPTRAPGIAPVSQGSPKCGGVVGVHNQVTGRRVPCPVGNLIVYADAPHTKATPTGRSGAGPVRVRACRGRRGVTYPPPGVPQSLGPDGGPAAVAVLKGRGGHGGLRSAQRAGRRGLGDGLLGEGVRQGLRRESEQGVVRARLPGHRSHPHERHGRPGPPAPAGGEDHGAAEPQVRPALRGPGRGVGSRRAGDGVRGGGGPARAAGRRLGAGAQGGQGSRPSPRVPGAAVAAAPEAPVAGRVGPQVHARVQAGGPAP